MVDLDHHHVSQPDSGDMTSPGESSRALVTTVPTVERPNVAVRPAAPFVAQLIATITDSPQTRGLRRAEPSHAANAYGTKPAAPIAPRHLSRFFL